jgi:hypothetical protein
MPRLRILLCFVTLTLSVLSGSATDRIVFLRLGRTQAILFISNADGSGEQPFTQPGSLDYNPSWSLKGNWIQNLHLPGLSLRADSFPYHLAPQRTGPR